MRSDVVILVNPAAGGGLFSTRGPGLLAEVRRRGWPTPVCTTHAGEAEQLAEEAGRRRSLVVAAGGDGFVSEIATGILRAGGMATLGILPLGTANDVASQLGLRSWSHALDVLDTGIPQALDTIEVQCAGGEAPRTRHALLFAAAGFAGLLLAQTTPHLKRWLGPRLCYSAGFLRALRTYQAPELQIETETARFAGRWFHVGAGNAERAGGRMRLSPGARWDDARLEICLVEELTRWQAVRHLPHLIRGTYLGHPKVRYFPGTWVSVSGEQPVPVALDGEVVGCTPARFTLAPGRLNLLAPGRPGRHEGTVISEAPHPALRPPPDEAASA